MHIILLIVGATCLITSIVMSIWFKTNRILNIYLLFTFCFASLFLFFHSLNHLWVFQKIEHFYLNYNLVILILMPTLYLYYIKLHKNIKFIETGDVFHYIVPLFFCISTYYTSFLNNLFFFLFIFCYSIFYLYKTFFVLKINYWSVKTNQPFTYDFSLVRSWTKFLFTIQVIYLSIVIFTKIYDIFYKNNSCNFYFEFILLIIYSSIYFKVIFSPVIFYGNPSLFKRIKTTSISKLCVTDVWNIKVIADSMSSKEQLLYHRIENNIIDYIEQIEEIALRNFAFRKPDYSLYQLSIEIGVPKYYLDFIFKYHCKVSFVEYKKIVRIYDSIQLINSGYLKTNKLDTLSKYVGYSSYNPFLVNFKELTGASPFEFYRNRKISKKC